MDKVKINLFGESWSLKELEIDEPVRSKILWFSKEFNRDINEFLLDLTFYEELNIPGIKSIADLAGTSIRGLQNSPRSQIEIWLNGKKILKIKSFALFYQNTLFKLYRTQETVVNFEDLGEGFFVFEREMGLIASYQFDTPKFSIDLLSFGILKFQIEGKTHEVLTDIFCDNILLVSKHSDALVTSSNCLVNLFDNYNK